MKFLIDEILKPIFRRMGTALAVLLATYGVDQGISDQIVLGFLALLGVTSDLIWSKFARDK